MKSILIRCDVSPDIGYGHGVRCLALARRLRDDHGIEAEFATVHPAYGSKFFRSAGFHVHEADTADENTWFADVVTSCSYRTVVVDVRTSLTREVLEGLRCEGVRFAVIDDPSDRRLTANWAFYPPVPQVRDMSWDGIAGQLYTGWDWVLIREEFVSARRRGAKTFRQGPASVLVSMGGSDPHGLTVKALAALEGKDIDATFTVMVGPGFADHDGLADVINKLDRTVTVITNPGDVAGLMRQHHFAIVAFGMTAYELAVLGVPALTITFDDDHARSASAFVDAGLGVSLTTAELETPNRLYGELCDIFQRPDNLRAMSERARETVDGGGAGRISAILAQALEAT